MVLLMVNKLLYAYASHCSITYRCSSVLERVGGATLHTFARKNAITLRAIVLPGLVVDIIRRASAHDFRHQAGKETKCSSHAVHVIDVQRAARP